MMKKNRLPSIATRIYGGELPEPILSRWCDAMSSRCGEGDGGIVNSLALMHGPDRLLVSLNVFDAAVVGRKIESVVGKGLGAGVVLSVLSMGYYEVDRVPLRVGREGLENALAPHLFGLEASLDILERSGLIHIDGDSVSVANAWVAAVAREMMAPSASLVVVLGAFMTLRECWRADVDVWKPESWGLGDALLGAVGLVWDRYTNEYKGKSLLAETFVGDWVYGGPSIAPGMLHDDDELEGVENGPDAVAEELGDEEVALLEQELAGLLVDDNGAGVGGNEEDGGDEEDNTTVGTGAGDAGTPIGGVGGVGEGNDEGDDSDDDDLVDLPLEDDDDDPTDGNDMIIGVYSALIDWCLVSSTWKRRMWDDLEGCTSDLEMALEFWAELPTAVGGLSWMRIRFAQCRSLTAQGSYDEALALIQEAQGHATIRGLRCTCLVIESNLHRRLGRWEKALSVAREAFELAGDTEDWIRIGTRTAMFQSLVSCGKFVEAREHQEIVIAWTSEKNDQDPMSLATNFTNMGHLAIYIEDGELAEKCVAAAEEIEAEVPEQASVWLGLRGGIRHFAGVVRKDAASFRAAIALDPYTRDLFAVHSSRIGLATLEEDVDEAWKGFEAGKSESGRWKQIRDSIRILRVEARVAGKGSEGARVASSRAMGLLSELEGYYWPTHPLLLRSAGLVADTLELAGRDIEAAKMREVRLPPRN